MSDNYAILRQRNKYLNRYCIIDSEIEGVESRIEFDLGVPIRHFFPENPAFFMAGGKDEDNEDFEGYKGAELGDFLANALNYLIISEKVKKIFEDELMANVEYIRVSIYDQDKKLAADNYYIANILDSFACLDLEKSVYRVMHSDPDTITTLKNVVLREDDIPESAKLFRLKEHPYTIIIRKDASDLLTRRKCSCFGLIPQNKKTLL